MFVAEQQLLPKTTKTCLMEERFAGESGREQKRISQLVQEIVHPGRLSNTCCGFPEGAGLLLFPR